MRIDFNDIRVRVSLKNLTMGNLVTSIDAQLINPDVAPDYNNPPKFDPNLGFPNGRRERVMVATQEEMEAAKVPLIKRDYCAHLFIDWTKCRDSVNPWPGHLFECKHEWHVYDQCQYDDFILRMKEYEREKRLLKRAKRINARKIKEEMAA